ncbi:hypothetical protein LIA77_04665 [Sarocladium implicatum]|nr:hypothetical protein LIA77_04665 [Sarocladium implicatum]
MSTIMTGGYGWWLRGAHAPFIIGPRRAIRRPLRADAACLQFPRKIRLGPVMGRDARLDGVASREGQVRLCQAKAESKYEIAISTDRPGLAVGRRYFCSSGTRLTEDKSKRAGSFGMTLSRDTGRLSSANTSRVGDEEPVNDQGGDCDGCIVSQVLVWRNCGRPAGRGCVCVWHGGRPGSTRGAVVGPKAEKQRMKTRRTEDGGRGYGLAWKLLRLCLKHCRYVLEEASAAKGCGELP